MRLPGYAAHLRLLISLGATLPTPLLPSRLGSAHASVEGEGAGRLALPGDPGQVPGAPGDSAPETESGLPGSAPGRPTASVAPPGTAVRSVQPPHIQSMLQALALPSGTPEQADARRAAIAAARAQELEATRGMPVTERLVSRVDAILGMPAVDPTMSLPRR